MTFASWNINRVWKDDSTWFGTYAGNYGIATLNGATDEAAHAFARVAADEGRFLPGTPEFEEAKASVLANPDFATGSKFRDNSKFYHSDFNYNFSHMWDWADVQVSGSYRQYDLNSQGSIYTDLEAPITYSEFGAYSQFVKDFLDERLKVTASARFDKSEFFDGRVTPRVSAYTAGEKRNHNIRASYQTGFRNPSTQGLFIGLDLGVAKLVGGAPNNPSRFSADYEVSVNGQAMGMPASIGLTGDDAYTNSYSVSSVTAFAAAAATGNIDPSILQSSGADYVTPEEMVQFELGYRGKFLFDDHSVSSLIIDANVYRNDFKNFINTLTVVTPYGSITDGSAAAAIGNQDFDAWSIYTNADAEVASWGATIGMEAQVGGFDLAANYAKQVLEFDRDAYPDFIRTGILQSIELRQFGNRNIFKNVGFNVAWRYSSEFYWEATFAEGPVPELKTVDAQINLTIPKWKSVLKAGATNIGGDDYFTAIGTGYIGQQVYISWTANNFNNLNKMIMKFKYIFFSVLLFSLTSCETDVEDLTAVVPAPYVGDSGSADFSSYVSLGASNASGFMDNSLFIAGQLNSFPNILAGAMSQAGGGEFTQPYVADNVGGMTVGGQEIAGERFFFNTQTFVPQGASGAITTEALDFQPGPYSNMSFPFVSAIHMVAPGYGDPAGLQTGTANPWFRSCF